MNNHLSRAACLAVAFTIASMSGGAFQASAQVVLPTGATITPTAAPGSTFTALTVALPDYPNYNPDSAETTAISPDGKTLLILTSGYNLRLDSNGNFQAADSNEYVFVYDISTPAAPLQKQVLIVPKAFGGLAWSSDGSKFYVTGAVNNADFNNPIDYLFTFGRSGGQWAQIGTPINLNHANDTMNQVTFVGPTAAGVAITKDGSYAVVANYETDSVTAVNLQNAQLTEYDLRPGIINPGLSGVAGGEFPFGVAIKGSNTVYVSSTRDREIDVLNLSAGMLTLTARIPVSGNPARMILNKAQTRLYVVAQNSDSLILIDTASNTVIGQVNTTAQANYFGVGKPAPKGANPNSVTLSPSEKIAYVTNGGTNSVAVINLSGSTPFLAGLIPTGWQPNSVSVSPDGRTLYVVNGKSVETANPLNCRNINAGGNYGSACMSPSSQNGSGNQYAWQNMQASLQVVPVPGSDDLTVLSNLVAQNNGFNLKLSPKENQIISFLRQHIKHVVYIVAENRTFDQVLGDLNNGSNGDSAFTQFPIFDTPNQHAFASNFVTLDNFHDSGAVSMDGWQWSTAARALDLNEKSVVVNYGKGGANYDSEGTARNINVAIVGVAARQAEQPLYPNDPNLLPGQANEVNADGPAGQPGLGYIWDAAVRAGLSVRNYGFFIDLGAVTAPPTLTDPCASNPPVNVAPPAHPTLLTLTDTCFRSFDQAFPDFFREQEWEREFNQQVATNTFPNLTLLRLNHDHFGSFDSASFGLNTPELQIADHDYSFGLVAQKIANSPYANSTLIVKIEDDPQDGADHVSGDRSICFLVGPYVKQGAVVSDHYSTVNVLRTIGMILGLPPLGVHDAGVPPMANAFDTTKATWNYTATVPAVLYNSTLPLPAAQRPKVVPTTTHNGSYWAEVTKGLNFSKEDLIEPGRLNRIIWEGMMGGKPYPAAKNLRPAGTEGQPVGDPQ
jgi:YVTN family beta-propeller protein